MQLNSSLISLSAAHRELSAAGYLTLAKLVEGLMQSVSKQLETMSYQDEK